MRGKVGSGRNGKKLARKSYTPYKKPTVNPDNTISRWKYNSPNNVTYVTSKVFLYNVAATGTGEVLGAQAFVLSLCPDSTTWGNAYDCYCIYRVDVYGFMSDVGPPGTSPANCQFITAIDYDDATAPANTSLILAYENSMIHPMGRNFKRSFKPRAVGGLYSGGSLVNAEAKGQTWIDLGTQTIEHYGLKFGWRQCTTTNVPTVALFAKFFVMLKRQR